MIEKIAVETERQRKIAEEVREAYSSRIEELRGYALEDEIEIREESERDFWEFVTAVPLADEGELVVLYNGNLRAVWQDDSGNHVGLQFLGDSSVEYVIFKHWQRSNSVDRVAGIDSLSDVRQRIADFDLTSLVRV